MKRTRWFRAAKQKPVRVGLYEFDCTVATPPMLRWDGKQWNRRGRIEGDWTPWGECATCRWRGLTKPGSRGEE